ncbi:MAG: hypothetical protein A3B68_04070 [Candidatus Melainabacteria bacterium RIFCSPHIGHO2_02_FULL_34_12]|nr:MAG: hypothetical protein A3B68_04070 [Candidatus Melainabacteria bacterium RIFCSPHIGHO2_02_FULL_34_12]
MKKDYIYYMRRRKKVLSELPENSILILLNKPASIRSNDVEYRFKPDSDFYYLTGFDEPNSACLLIKERHKSFYVLFVEPKDREKEIWTGKQIGINGAKSIFKADLAFEYSKFFEKLEDFISGKEYIYYSLGKYPDHDQKILKLINDIRKSNRSGARSPKGVNEPFEILSCLRLIKDELEIDCMKKAADISKDAHILAMSYAKPGMYEYELEAILEYKFKKSGSLGPAYSSIVGAGKNATILHYINNSEKIKKNDLILIDAGCEYKYYASDLTRTFPANKKFTAPQKALYEIVLESQIKSIELMKPGKRFIDSYNKAVEILVEGLKDLKLLKGSIQEIIAKKKYRKYFMHKLSHWLGLDVHDAGPYLDKNDKSIKLVSGMVMTVEPGIYISSELDDVPEKFKGIGIRIEDDILITKSGNKVLTEGTPKQVDEIEAFS